MEVFSSWIFQCLVLIVPMRSNLSTSVYLNNFCCVSDAFHSAADTAVFIVKITCGFNFIGLFIFTFSLSFEGDGRVVSATTGIRFRFFSYSLFILFGTKWSASSAFFVGVASLFTKLMIVICFVQCACNPKPCVYCALYIYLVPSLVDSRRSASLLFACLPFFSVLLCGCIS